MRGRATLVVLHRWAGLTIAGFLLVAGVTGATLPFREELTWLCAPALWRAAPPAAGARPLPGPELAERVAAQTGGQPVQVPLRIDGDHAIAMFVFARPGARPLGYDRVIVDPYSGQVRERLRFGAIEAFPRDLPTFLLALHYGYIAGKAGQLVFGLAAMIWLLDGLVGVALTFPIRMRSRKLETHRYQRKPWLERWAPAWRVRRHARGHRLTFDLHRAGGLWLWIASTIFAWSAFGMNVPAFRDALARIAGTPPNHEAQDRAGAAASPKLGYVEAAHRGAVLMAREAAARRFRIVSPERLDYLQASATYRYTARTSLDFTDYGATSVWFDAGDRRELAFEAAVGEGMVDKVNGWSDALHEAAVWGLPYRIAVSMFGLLVTVLTVTGVLVWSKKRAARLSRRP